MDVEDAAPVGLLKIIVGLLAMLGVAAIAGGFWVAVPQFEELFQGFGATPPPLTKFVIDFYLLIALLLTGGFLLQGWYFLAMVFQRSTRAYHAVRLIAMLYGAALVVILIALYGGVFQLGSEA
jgi:hypothetical protein